VFIEHIAVWTEDLERLRSFYETYFSAHSGSLYINPVKQFRSYFLHFESGARLEIMSKPKLTNSDIDRYSQTGFAHLAMAVDSKEAVNALSAQLERDGFSIVDGPRFTGDGYYESVCLDPDGNRIEITSLEEI